jgi:hypothetical protein
MTSHLIPLNLKNQVLQIIISTKEILLTVLEILIIKP